jgi:hypothetical protein
MHPWLNKRPAIEILFNLTTRVQRDNRKRFLMETDPAKEPIIVTEPLDSSSSTEQAKAVEDHRHPLDNKITSPDAASEHLKQMGEAALSEQPLMDTQEGRRNWWVSGGNNRDDPYILNWTGPRDSKWDWVGLACHKGGNTYVWAAPGATAWQWASNGNSYVTNYTPDWIENVFGGDQGFAMYFIWNATRGYVGQIPPD